ncbi:MAG: TetR/AcrR family transcriptional regulator [Proteobacteria bacterium]|nr:TetR/AcrR family transcriptional regulator [Pseudomonadota bacterium]
MPEKSKFMKLKDEEREARRELFIYATLNLLEKMPFDEIGMRDIAAEVGVSAASIYRYFTSREDLFVEAFIKDMSVFQFWLEKKMKGKPMSIEDFSLAIADHLIESEPTFQMMSFLMIKGKMNPELLQKFNALQRAFIDRIDQVIRETGATSHLRLFSHVFLSSITGLLMSFRNYPGREKEDIKNHIRRLARLLSAIFQKGIPLTQAEISNL